MKPLSSYIRSGGDVGALGRRLHAGRQHHHVESSLDLAAAEDILNRDGDVSARCILLDLGYLAFGQRYVLIFLDHGQEVLVLSRSAQIDVKDRRLAVLGIGVAHVCGLFKRGHTADRGAVIEIVLVTAACALHKSHVLDFLAIGRPQDPALGRPVRRRQAFHHHVGDDIAGGGKVQVVNLRRVVWIPAGGEDDAAGLDLDGLGLHIQIDGVVFASLDTLLATAGAGALVDDIAHRESHFVRQIDGAGCIHAVVEIVGTLSGAFADAVIAAGALLVDVTRGHLDSCRVIPLAAGDAF